MLEKNQLLETAVGGPVPLHEAFGHARPMPGIGWTGGWQECGATLLDFKRWTTLAWTDIRLRYRRTVLGPWWGTISTGALIGSVGLVFGTIFGGQMSDYLPYFACGVIVWAFISGSLNEGCVAFLNASGLIKSIPAPLVLHVYRMQWRMAIVLGHNLVLVVLVWLIFRWPIGWSIFLALPGLALVTVALFGAALALAILCTRFRDIPPLILTMLQLFFLLTPIVWMPTGVRAEKIGPLVYWNPFYYLVEIVRGPFLDQPPDLRIWLAAGLVTAASLGVGLGFYGRFRHRVPYWL